MSQKPVAYTQLWFWGLMCILAGTVGAGVSQSVFPANRPDTRAEAAGAAFGQVFLIAVGLVLLVIHFSRRLRTGAAAQLPTSGRVSVVCPHCDRSMRIPRSALGKRVRCDDCDERFVAEEEEDDRDEERAGSKTSMLAGLIASSVGLVLALVGMVWLAVRGLSDEAPSNNRSVPAQRPPVVLNPIPGNNPVPGNNQPAVRPPVVAPVAAAAPVVATPDAVLAAEGPVDRLGISPDGKTLLAANRQSFSLWSAEAGNNKPRATFKMLPPQTPVSAPAFSPDSRTFVLGGGPPTVYVRDTTTGEERGRIPLPVQQRPGQQPLIQAVAFAPDGKKLVAGLQTFEQKPGLPSNLYLCDVVGQRVDRKLPGGHQGGVRALAYSPNGDLLVSAGADGIVRIWDAQTYREQKALGTGSKLITAATFSPDGRWLAIASEDGKVHLYSVQNQNLSSRGTLALAGPVHDVRFSSNGRLLATAGADGSARLWDPDRLQERVVLRPEGNDPMLALVFGKDDAVLFTACGKAIQRWNVARALAAQ